MSFKELARLAKGKVLFRTSMYNDKEHIWATASSAEVKRGWAGKYV